MIDFTKIYIMITNVFKFVHMRLYIMIFNTFHAGPSCNLTNPAHPPPGSEYNYFKAIPFYIMQTLLMIPMTAYFCWPSICILYVIGLRLFTYERPWYTLELYMIVVGAILVDF